MRKFIFVGGSGRSGTTFLTEAIGLNERVLSFPSIELKFLTSREGLLDLRHCLIQEYDIDSAQQALNAFEKFLERVFFEKFFNSVSVDAYCDAEQLRRACTEFSQAVRLSGRATIASAEHFDAAARRLMDAVFSAATRLAEAGVSPIYNLEKTPHSLLHMNSLNEIFPQTKFVHVMRDPRAIVLSLLSMDWAPTTTDECVVWLKCYCRAWARSRDVAVANGASLLELRLEDIAADPGRIVARLSEFLALDIAPDVFDGVRPDIGFSWKERCTNKDVQHLTAALAEEMSFLGYD